MVLIIIKNSNKNIFYLIVSLFFISQLSCSTKVIKKDIQEDFCELFEDSLTKVSFSENENDLRYFELSEFYYNDNDYDIIIYNHLEGSNFYKLIRFYKNKKGKWTKVNIENGTIKKSIIEFNEIEIIDDLNKIEDKSLFQYCGYCFDCTYYTFLIKKNKSIFKYYSSKGIFNNISYKDKKNIYIQENIYNFFEKIL